MRFEYFSEPVYKKGVVGLSVITESDNAFTLKIIFLYLFMCWGRFLVEAAPTLLRQYHGSCLPKAVKAECY